MNYHFSFDTGRVLAQRTIDIHPEQTREQLSDAMGQMGAELMLDVLDNLKGYWDRALDQDENMVTYGKSRFFFDLFSKWLLGMVDR